jgi:hypothetical protein
MIQGIGAAVFTTLAGAVIVVGGYDAAMAALTGIAVLALVLLIVGVPETARHSGEPPGRRLGPPGDPLPRPVPA